MNKNTKKGKITVIIGCMFSGKSTEIIRRYKRYISINKNVILINHKNDDRYGYNIVSSHDKIKLKCIVLNNLMDIFKTSTYTESDIIIIEEAQFFPDLFKFVTHSADILKKNIIVAGLDGDSKREPFGDILKLIPHAEEVVKLSALCKICNDGTVANFTKRIVENDSQCLIGGSDTYIPVCRAHFLK